MYEDIKKSTEEINEELKRINTATQLQKIYLEKGKKCDLTVIDLEIDNLNLKDMISGLILQSKVSAEIRVVHEYSSLERIEGIRAPYKVVTYRKVSVEDPEWITLQAARCSNDLLIAKIREEE